MIRNILAVILATGGLGAAGALAQGTNVAQPMGFFVTSVGWVTEATLAGSRGLMRIARALPRLRARGTATGAPTFRLRLRGIGASRRAAVSDRGHGIMPTAS